MNILCIDFDFTVAPLHEYFCYPANKKDNRYLNVIVTYIIKMHVCNC